VFYQGSDRRELARIQRVNRVGDTSADPGSLEAYRQDMPRSTARTAARLAAQAGLAPAQTAR
jgi:roadblock/LC7 domain-containing protein